jgi:hypothetical protein
VVQTLLPLLFLILRALCDLCGEIVFAFAVAIYYLLATIYFMFVIAFAANNIRYGAAPTKKKPL